MVVRRIHLKTRAENRSNLIDYCLNHKDNEQQCLAIGWSGVFELNPNINTYEEYYNTIKPRYNNRKYDHSHNVFRYAQQNDLFWTRDLSGYYWICRVTGQAEAKYIPSMDIGAILPVEAYRYGLEVPGQIKASFNRPRSGTCEDIKDEVIAVFSKDVFNRLSNTKHYEIEKVKANLLDILPDFDLEELVITYIQLKENYYLLSNSIANKSTTIKIECELISRDIKNPSKAVVQVKGGNRRQINALEYNAFDNDGYTVFLYAPKVINKDSLKKCIVITRDQLLAFYYEYKNILPDSITKWENII